MSAWDDLEAYLVRLVNKIGGTSYVLRDSGGRHLAPRLAAPVDGETIIEEAIRRGLIGGGKGDPSIAEALVTLLHEQERNAQISARFGEFKQHAAVLDRAVGVDFVKEGPGKRYLHRQADLPFIAERFLSSYLLIIAFHDAAAVDAQGVVLALERARATIGDILARLPPDGGGQEALSNAMRWR